MTYAHICRLLATRNCYDAGHPVAEIAKAAKKSTTTIYRWLKVTQR